ncbi:MAG: class I SAM-dependent methyltransferase [Eubacteriales bacterium]|nr:class I SAM-dependent methyltransferase [Eubacteriales bacterium]MDZ4043463.1 class I SAM-dependent methyltransferase [Eubacteriales bacterium]MDZ7609324.1 class I SAM-dependent methyltransferase [Eubacteriales bacterium]
MDSESIGLGRLYDDLAYLMPLISPPEEYAEEAAHWRAILREKLGKGRHKLLELGVGGGHNLSYLTSDFEATAVDISEAMLAQCKRLNPTVEVHVGDMRSIRLGRKFPVVLIHDAISYILSESDLLATFRSVAAHLEPGGVFITSPDHFAETFHALKVGHATHSDGNMEVTYLEYTYDPDPSDTKIETIMFYLIRAEGGLRIEHDRHVTGLFPKSTWIGLMNEAGFSVEERAFHLGTAKQPYELLVGVLR